MPHAYPIALFRLGNVIKFFSKKGWAEAMSLPPWTFAIISFGSDVIAKHPDSYPTHRVALGHLQELITREEVARSRVPNAVHLRVDDSFSIENKKPLQYKNQWII
jgi:hypothetical protein